VARFAANKHPMDRPLLDTRLTWCFGSFLIAYFERLSMVTTSA
jgi:hypothetical protein